MNKPHKHAALMLQYAQDAAETERPWERWEYRYDEDETWKPMQGNRWFHPDNEYRRKPRTININGFEVPEPMREKPELGTVYFFPCLHNEWQSNSFTWRDYELDVSYFQKGFCHYTREADKLHAKALLSFTKKEETK